MIVYIDTEVRPQSEKVSDYGAVREDGAKLHTQSYAEWRKFTEGCRYVCGHNIVSFDLEHVELGEEHVYIDTLYWSPLLFPKKPYHRLLKDDKLQVDELNNPLNDALKARDLFHDEVAAWLALPARRQSIYRGLLAGKEGYEGLFDYLEATIPSRTGREDFNRLQHLGQVGNDLSKMIAEEYAGLICSNTNLTAVIKHYPVELAYALAVIGADDMMSITPSWVMHNYPKVGNVMNFLRNTPCGECLYCRSRLDAHSGLREFFGYEAFRQFAPQKGATEQLDDTNQKDCTPSNMQQEAVEAALRGESLLTIFPTGGGKSLTFQLPALMAGRNIHGLTVIISPLQSLMKDQVDSLTARGIADAVTINGLQDPLERAAAIGQVADGTANLLYIAPEMLRSKTIERLLLKRNVVRFVIDEAHCFSAWGQDFRTDYLYIGDFIRSLQEQKNQSQPIAVSCFTATAKQKVISDIRNYFHSKLGLELKVFAANAERENLRYSVLHADTDSEKYTQLRSLILGHHCPTIVYVSRTRRTQELAARLNSDGINARPFNGKMEAAEKVTNQEAFMSGAVQVIVATNAFGMGVDKKDVGLVVHYDISDSLENYVQEAGRAGRDPQMEAECYVLYSDSDLDKHFILLNQTKLSISEIQQVWQAIKALTARREDVSCSPLEIARQAGWNTDDAGEIETRIRSAVTALEEAGFIKRSSNAPHIFATGIKVHTMNEARQRITASPLFDDTTREEAIRIIHHLISSRATAGGRGGEAESRIDYLSDLLGINKESVIRSVNLMRQEGILADTQDMTAYVSQSNPSRVLEELLRLERFVLESIDTDTQVSNYKQLNAEAQTEGHTRCTVKMLRSMLHFLAIKGYVCKEEHHGGEYLSVRLQVDREATMRRFEQRMDLCRFIVRDFAAMATERMFTFSSVELMERYTASQSNLFGNRKITLDDVEEALLYLSRMGLLKIEGGFMVIYSTMQLHRQVERTRRYGKEQYRLLDEFYRQRIQQIHIVGEYANLMVRDYDAALRFVHDYFTMEYRQFIARYFKGERRTQIAKNISPAKYNQLFDTLSPRQREIIDDHQSKYIVVAAGPGSGKTRVLVHKLASLLLMEDVKHEQLLMLTFSRAAATEFKSRLMELVGNAAHFVAIKTFHSYSFDLLGRQGTLEEADSVVRRAAEMIESGEAEDSKVAKSVLVIDEAQDMGADDFRLVRALMQRNEEMRVIAVGDDDQNIYAFRGSNSQHLRSLVSDYGATLYELTDNYRSDRAIVNYANRFVQQIPNRMKQVPIMSVSNKEGLVEETNESNLDDRLGRLKGTTAILTITNEQSLLVASQLRRQAIPVRLVQGTDGFRFINLAEVRYFFKHLASDSATIEKAQWDQAKSDTVQAYATSRCLDAMRKFWHDFESTHRTYYRSELREFALESGIEDFIVSDNSAVYVGTIHKAKGREFDNVLLLLDDIREMDDNMLRTIYVGITRAKHRLSIFHQDKANRTDKAEIVFPLTMRDVWLSYFRDHKEAVLRLRSGDTLRYSNGRLINEQGVCFGRLSTAMLDRIKGYEEKGYHMNRAEVSYILAWRPREEPQEVAVCLANLYMNKNTSQE